MGLDVPELDDKTYEELVEEARKLLPAYSEAWTNYNPQDPGITVLETLAYLTDTYTYQLDTVTDTHREKYLRLMDERRRPPSQATARLSLAPPDGESGLRIPAGTRLVVVDGSGSEKTFETDAGLVLTDAEIERVVTESDAGRTDHTHANGTDGMYYRPLGDEPTPGSVMALGLSGDPFASAETLSVTVAFHDDDLPAPATHGQETPSFEPSVEVVWEYCTDYTDPVDAWEPFDVVRDDTNHLYEGGTVTLAAPDPWTPGEWLGEGDGLYGGTPGLVWIRCRVEQAGYEIPPQLDAVRLGVVTASNRRTVTGERLSRVGGDRDPSTLTEQRYQFRYTPVLDATVTVDGERWTEVEDLDASGPTDRHYVLDPAAGVVRFGDGVTGKLPEPDQRVVAEEYVAGGGEAGNVPASANWRFADGETTPDGDRSLSDVSVTPIGAASGGADAESLAQAFRRVKRDLQTPYRAVTRDDVEYLAAHTPGLRVGRAKAFLSDRAESNSADAPPVARVVVVPYAPGDVSRPTPSEGFRRAVQDHLDEHRLVTDRVQVERPTYVDVSVTATLQTARWRPPSDGEAELASAIRAYLDPNHGYEGDGWPFGRTLYADELAAVLADVEWVDAVQELSVTAPGNARVDTDGNVRIGEEALFALADLTTTVKTGSRRGDHGGA